MRIIFLSERLYTWLLLAYPPSFRREFGEEMALVFGDCCRDAWRQGRALGLASLWLRVAGDWAASVVRERIHSAEAAMNGKSLAGLLLVVFSFGNILYDAVTVKAAMGIPAIFLTALAAGLGGALLARGASAHPKTEQAR
jgi:hypothetical protein